MLITKTFRFRLEPTAFQRNLFAQYAGCCRFVFNQGLAASKASYEATGKSLSYAEQCKALTELKTNTDTSWLGEINAQVLQQALKDLQSAYRHFFRRVKDGESPGFPRFKRKGRQDSFRYPQDVKVRANQVYLPKIGWVDYRESRPIEGRLLQTTIKREGRHWFVCFACEIDRAVPPRVLVSMDRAVGIDVGISRFAVLSTGAMVDSPRFLERALLKLRRAQRRLIRKKIGSRNWRKQVNQVIKLQIRVKNSRMDFCHKVSTSIVKNHDVIAVETLNIRGMLKNRRLARSISDAGWGSFFEMLKYKAAWHGKHFIQIGRFEPTTKRCSSCGSTRAMSLSTRVFECDSCGLVIDRDWNASLNIRAAGLAVLNACGGA